MAARLDAYAAETLEEPGPDTAVDIDAVVSLAELDRDALEWVSTLEPYGPGNPRPVFASLGVSVREWRTMGYSDQHVRFVVKQDGNGRYRPGLQPRPILGPERPAAGPGLHSDHRHLAGQQCLGPEGVPLPAGPGRQRGWLTSFFSQAARRRALVSSARTIWVLHTSNGSVNAKTIKATICASFKPPKYTFDSSLRKLRKNRPTE